MTAVSL